MSAATSAEAVAMGRSALTADVRVLEEPELLIRDDGCVLVTKVMVDVDGLCVTSFCWTARKANGFWLPPEAQKGSVPASKLDEDVNTSWTASEFFYLQVTWSHLDQTPAGLF
jgi:hypothetical protein